MEISLDNEIGHRMFLWETLKKSEALIEAARQVVAETEEELSGSAHSSALARLQKMEAAHSRLEAEYQRLRQMDS